MTAVTVLVVIGVTLGACNSEHASSTPSTSTTAPSTAAITGQSTTSTTPSTTATTTAPTTSPAASSTSCRARGSGEYVLPDPTCTPGATNPQVTQADIDSTICRSGWATSVRPPESYTEPLKLQQMAAYGYQGQSPAGFEEDHLIPLELGGSPTDPRNLWPETGASPNPKDAVEGAANRAVCDGRMTLTAAQQAIATDWVALGQQLGVTPSGV